MRKFFSVFSLLLLLFAQGVIAGQPARTYTITAHSGAYDTPENSMEFIQTALDNKDEILEFDVRLRPDGSLAMSHDAIKSNQDGVDIPQALRKIKETSTRVNLDIKEIRTLPALYKVIQELGMQQQVFFTGISQKDVETVHRECPGIVFYINYNPDKKQMKDKAKQEEMLQILRDTNSPGINISYSYCNKRLVKLLHDNGYEISLWTLNDRKNMKKYAKMQPDNITTRHPDWMREVSKGK